MIDVIKCVLEVKENSDSESLHYSYLATVHPPMMIKLD